MSDIRIVNENNEEVDSQPVEIKTPPNIEEGGLVLRSEVAKLFDFTPNEIASYKNKLDTLIEYAKTKTEDHSPEGIKWAVRQLGVKLGTPPLTERLIEYLYRFAYLSLEGNKIEDQKKKFLMS